MKVSRRLLSVLCLTIVLVVGLVFLTIYKKLAITGYWYQHAKNIPIVSKNTVKFEYLTKNGNSQGRKYLYYTSNKQLFNSTEGTNYYIGYFSSLEPVQGSVDKLIYISEIRNKSKLRVFRIIYDPANLPIQAVTSIGVERATKNNLQRARNWLSNTEILGTVLTNPELINNFKKGDVLVIQFLHCPNEQTNCIKDSDGNIFISNILKRS